jgi:hypothetical protein
VADYDGDMSVEGLAAELKAYDDWLVEHMDELCARYPGKFVAFYPDRIVKVCDSNPEIAKWLRRSGLHPEPMVIRVPTKEDIEYFLPAPSLL